MWHEKSVGEIVLPNSAYATLQHQPDALARDLGGALGWYGQTDQVGNRSDGLWRRQMANAAVQVQAEIAAATPHRLSRVHPVRSAP